MPSPLSLDSELDIQETLEHCVTIMEKLLPWYVPNRRVLAYKITGRIWPHVVFCVTRVAERERSE